jgi:hypothetical protein
MPSQDTGWSLIGHGKMTSRCSAEAGNRLEIARDRRNGCRARCTGAVAGRPDCGHRGQRVVTAHVDDPGVNDQMTAAQHPVAARSRRTTVSSDRDLLTPSDPVEDLRQDRTSFTHTQLRHVPPGTPSYIRYGLRLPGPTNASGELLAPPGQENAQVRDLGVGQWRCLPLTRTPHEPPELRQRPLRPRRSTSVTAQGSSRSSGYVTSISEIDAGKSRRLFVINRSAPTTTAVARCTASAARRR